MAGEKSTPLAAGSHSGVIVARPESLRAAAAQLNAVVSDIEAVIPGVKDIPEAARTDSSQHTVDGAPSGIYAPVLESVDTVNGKIERNLNQLRENMAADAQLLLTQADKIEANESNHASQIHNL